MDSNAKEILNFIGKAPQGRSLYQIIRSFGFPDAPYDLLAILNYLVAENLTDLHQPEAGANAKYLVTPKGIHEIKQ